MKTFRLHQKAWPSLLIAHLQNLPQGKGDVSKHKKKVHHEKWSLATVDEKGDTRVNPEVHSSVVK